jgi:hypothetical protein
MAEEQSPWFQLRPPVTDYMTYLTFIEHNLTEQTLPILHQVLQDTELNVGIGWDLVHLLIPLVPASEECLLDVARLGNPREVVLKVSEALRLLDLENLEFSSDTESEVAEKLEKATVAESSKAASSNTPQADPAEPALPMPIQQFKVLLSMLSVLHPRIKTKYPSRFLSTTLQGVLAAYSRTEQCHDELTHEVVKFVKTIAGAKRPHLPPRSRSSQILSSYSEIAAPDPEAQPEVPSNEETTMQNRLLQSFLTHIFEDYMLSMKSENDVPGMAWSSRLQEKLHPERTPKVPGKISFTDQFGHSESLQSFSATVGSIVALAQDLGLTSQELYEVVVDPKPEITGEEDNEDEPPLSPSDIPISKSGALFLLAARKAAENLYDQPVSTPEVSIFPDHSVIVENFVGGASHSTMGLEPEALIDTVLFLGLLALEEDIVGEPTSDESFCQYLQNTSLLSANTPSPTLRYHAYYLTSTVLRSHPHDLVRLSFIRDTLEHCPYENLKTSAVGWFKGETIEANPPSSSSVSDSDTPSIFATPVALSTISPFLYPDLTDHFTGSTLQDSYVQFRADLSFYLAALNFYYLLLIAKHLHGTLDIVGFQKSSSIAKNYLEPLRNAVATYRAGLEVGGELHDGDEDIIALKELDILEDVIGRAETSSIEMKS